MIKIDVIGYPIVYQSDNFYLLPSTTGAVQWNGNAKRFEVSTGSSWTPIDQRVTLNTDNNLIQCINWVKEKMVEENQLQEKAKNNPALADLLRHQNEIKEQIKLVDILTK